MNEFYSDQKIGSIDPIFQRSWKWDLSKTNLHEPSISYKMVLIRLKNQSIEILIIRLQCFCNISLCNCFSIALQFKWSLFDNPEKTKAPSANDGKKVSNVNDRSLQFMVFFMAFKFFVTVHCKRCCKTLRKD